MTARERVEEALRRLEQAAPQPSERASKQGQDWELPPPSEPRTPRHVQPPRPADNLTAEHRALIGKYATVDLPDGSGVARLRVYTVTVRRDGRVRAEMRNGAQTVYKQPSELRDVSATE